MKTTTKNLLDDKSKIETKILNDMEMLISPAYQYHEFEFLSDSKCITFSTNLHSGEDYENDTFRINDITTFKLDKKG